jgi:glycosyltransferase involved in cell wall biosynthesis
MRVAFLVNDLQLSGGVGVVIQHAKRLSSLEGWDVTLVSVRSDDEPSWSGYEHLPDLHVRSRREALEERYDVAVATWWETTFTLFELSAARYAYFVQNLEDRFYHDGEAERLGAGLTSDLPVAFITEAQWIVDTLAALRPDAPCYLVRNGIDKAVFPPLECVPQSTGGPLRILVEGSPAVWFKRVPDAIQAANAMNEPRYLTVVSGDRSGVEDVTADQVVGPLSHRELATLYRDTDVVLKLSTVEGMFGPPLEGFHCGATCVVTPVTGHEEYVVHGFNGLLTDWDDVWGTARQLDLLARDQELLYYLRSNALDTARAWPDWEESSQLMATALLSIRSAPQPSSTMSSSRLLADLRGGIEMYHRHLQERDMYEDRARRFERRIQRVLGNRYVRRVVSLRRYRLVRIAARPVRPLLRRILRMRT